MLFPVFLSFASGIKLARRPRPPTKSWPVLLCTTQYYLHCAVLLCSTLMTEYYTVLLRTTQYTSKELGRSAPGSGMHASLSIPLLKSAMFQSRKGVGSTGAFPWVLKPPGIKMLGARGPQPSTGQYYSSLFNTCYVLLHNTRKNENDNSS